MRTSRILTSMLALILGSSLAIAQQGEGTAGDFILQTQINGGGYDTLDKAAAPFDVLGIRLQSPMGGCANRGFILVADVRPTTEDYVEVGVVGLNAATRTVIYDSIFGQAFGAVIPGFGLTLDVNFQVPCSAVWNSAPSTGFWLQAAGLDPTSMTALFGIYEVSETVKHPVNESPYPCQWYDACDDALAADGITDADLGFPYMLDTTTATDDVDATGLDSTFGTDTVFTCVVAGAANNATGSDGPSGDFIAKFTAGGGSYTFDMCASTYDTRIWLMNAACPTAMSPVTGIASNDDASGDPMGACVMGGHQFASRLRNICLSPGQVVLIVIDGYAGAEGMASLTITKQEVVSTAPSPSSGDVAGGTMVSFAGCGLSSVSSVTFDGIAAGIITQTNTSLVVSTPAHAAGAVDVVLNHGMSSTTFMGGYTYTAGMFAVCSTPALPIVFGTQSDTLTVMSSGAITSLNIDMNITHTWRGDILMDLTSPSGTILRLHNGAGGSADNIIGNYPGTLAPSGGGPSSGPAFNLSDFLGEDPMGIWTLDIEDTDPADNGTLNMWCVNGSL